MINYGYIDEANLPAVTRELFTGERALETMQIVFHMERLYAK